MKNDTTSLRHQLFQAIWSTYSLRKMVELFANSGDPDQTLQSVASDLGLNRLPVNNTRLGVPSLQWVNYD